MKRGRPRRQSRMIIGAGIFNVLFQHKIPRIDAISEFIDNAFGPAAGDAAVCRITFGKNKITIADDGVGVRDLNLILTPGESGSRDNAADIGSYGIGAKFGMFHFGKTVKINTVRDGRRHVYSIDFGLARERDQMPLLYRGNGSPAPRSRGTEIIVSELHEGRHNPSYKYLCDGLAHRYLLAQRAGRKIIMNWPGAKGDVELKGDDVVSLYEQDKREYSGEIAGRPFTVLAGDIKEYSPTLSGLHIGFGFRFIMKLTELDGHALPPLFYGRVILGNEWKTCLSPDKTEIMQDRKELEAKIYELLRDWIEQLRTMAEQYRTEQICARLAASMRDVMQAAGAGTDYVEGKKKAHTGGGNGEDGDDQGGDSSDTLQPELDLRGSLDAKPAKQETTGIHFKIVPLGPDAPPFIVQFDNGALVFTLNEDIPIIRTAWAAPFKLPVIWSIVSLGLAARCVTDIKLAKTILCDQSVFDSVDLNDHEMLYNSIGKVAAHLMKAQPDTKAFVEELIDERSAAPLQ